MRCGLYVCLCISVITLNNCVHTSALSTALPCSSLRIWKCSILTVLSMQKPNFLQQLSSKSLWARRIDYYQRLIWLHIQREPMRWKAAGTYCSFGADLRSKCIICASDAGYFLTFSPVRTGAFTVNFPNPLDPWRNADILILFQVPSGKRTLTYERVSAESRRADSRDITRDGRQEDRRRAADNRGAGVEMLPEVKLLLQKRNIQKSLWLASDTKQTPRAQFGSAADFLPWQQ